MGLWLLRWLTDHTDNCSLQCVTVSGCDGRHCGEGRRQGLALASGAAQSPWTYVAQVAAAELRRSPPEGHLFNSPTKRGGRLQTLQVY